MISIGSEKVEISILKSKDRNEEMVKNTVRIHIEEIESKLVYQGLNTYMQARPSEHKFRAPPHIDELNCFNKKGHLVLPVADWNAQDVNVLIVFFK